MDISKQHYRVALSFPSEHRTFVKKIAELLASELTRNKVFYDQWYEAELAVLNLDDVLQNIYLQQSDLVVVFLCKEYEEKEWCKLEWRAVREILKNKDPKLIMPIRFDETKIPGIFTYDGHVPVNKRKPDIIADLILKRLDINKPTPNKIKKPRKSIFISVIAFFFILFCYISKTVFIHKNYVELGYNSLPKPVTLTVNNETNCQLKFYLQGPSTPSFFVNGGSEETVEVASGTYKFGVDTNLCPRKLPSMLGNEVFEAGGSYTLTLGEQIIQSKTTNISGQYEIQNETGVDMNVKVGSISRTVASGTASISLKVGSYSASIKAKCGSRTELFEITQDETYTVKYWCDGGKLSVGSTESTGEQSGSGEFIVHNDTGETLTVNVGGKSRYVRGGISTISLPVGNYNATIVSLCGSEIESFSIEAGSQYEGHYRCLDH
jgi:hypothetical protein